MNPILEQMGNLSVENRRLTLRVDDLLRANNELVGQTRKWKRRAVNAAEREAHLRMERDQIQEAFERSQDELATLRAERELRNVARPVEQRVTFRFDTQPRDQYDVRHRPGYPKVEQALRPLEGVLQRLRERANTRYFHLGEQVDA